MSLFQGLALSFPVWVAVVGFFLQFFRSSALLLIPDCLSGR